MRRSPILAALVAAVLSGPGAGTAQAGTYVHEPCVGDVDGATYALHGAYITPYTACDENVTGIGVAFPNVRPHGPGEFGELRYTVPADTTLASVSGHRSARVTGSVPYGTNTASLFLGGLRAEFFADVGSENRAASGAIAYAAPSGSTYFRVLMECSGSSTCPQTDSWYRISQLRIGLLDTFDPAIKDVTGSITSPAAAQSKTVGVSTSDRGGGVRTVQFRVDGGAWQDSGSFCSAPYRLRVPCPLARSHSFSIDTRPLPDGDRSVTLRADGGRRRGHRDAARRRRAVLHRPGRGTVALDQLRLDPHGARRDRADDDPGSDLEHPAPGPG
jgi:hypothetical protein